MGSKIVIDSNGEVKRCAKMGCKSDSFHYSVAISNTNRSSVSTVLNAGIPPFNLASAFAVIRNIILNLSSEHNRAVVHSLVCENERSFARFGFSGKYLATDSGIGVVVT